MLNGIITPEEALGEAKRIIAKATRGDTLEMIETFFKIQTKEGQLVPMKLKPAQFKYWQDRSEADIIVKAAQMGISTEVITEFTADAFVIPNLEVLITAQRDESVKELFQIVSTIQATLPAELAAKTTKDTEHSITIDHSDIQPGAVSRITTGTILSKSIGRGRPRHRALFTEVGFYPTEAISAVAGVIARMPRGYSRIVMESTANGQAGYLYNLWLLASGMDIPAEELELMPKVDFKPHFFAWFEAPEYRIEFNLADKWGGKLIDFDEQEKWLQDTHNLDEDQLRWRRWMIARLGSIDMFNQEFPDTADKAFLPVGSAVFKPSLIDQNATQVKPPVHKTDGWLVWKEPDPMRNYMVIIDQASGEQRDPNNKPLDYSVINVFDPVTLEQMAMMRRRDITTKPLAKASADIASLYNDALVCPEANLAKFGFFEWLMDFGVKNIYMHLNPNSKPGAMRATMGYPMNKATKPALVDNMKNVFDIPGATTIRSENFIREARNFRYLSKQGMGAMGAPPGGNDDELITGLIGFAPEVRSQANTIKRRGRLATVSNTSSAPTFRR